MIVEVDEVRRRFAARVDTLDGFREADGPFDPASAPDGLAARPFSLLVPASLPNGTRDRSLGAMEIVTRAVLRINAPLKPAASAKLGSLDDELRMESRVIRELMKQGDDWTRGLRISYAGSDRTVLPGDEWLQTDLAFDVAHMVQL